MIFFCRMVEKQTEWDCYILNRLGYEERLTLAKCPSCGGPWQFKSLCCQLAASAKSQDISLVDYFTGPYRRK